MSMKEFSTIRRKVSLSILAVTMILLILITSPSIFVSGYSPSSSSSLRNVQYAQSPFEGQLGTTASSAEVSSSSIVGCSNPCIYISDYGSAQISVLNASTKKLLTTIPLEASAVPFGVTYVPTLKEIFVGDYGDNQLLVIDTSTNKIVKNISITAPTFMAYDPKNGMLFVSEFGYGIVQTVNASSRKVGPSIPVCGIYPEFIDYNTVDGKLYVPARFNGNNQGCYDVINPKTNTATNVTLGTYPTGVAVNQKTGAVYISDFGVNEVYEVKGTKLITTINSPEFSNARLWGLVYSPKTNDIYVAATNNDTVIPINSTNFVGSAIAVGQGPDFGCYISTKHDILITNTHGLIPGNVTLISAKNLPVKTIKLGKTSSQPYGCAES